MSKFNARVSVFKIDDTGGILRNLSTYLTEISGLPGERELLQQTGIGATGRERDTGLENGRFRIAGFFDDTGPSGPDVVLGALRTHTSAVDFEYGPKGSTSTYVKYYGTCWCRSYTLTSRVGTLVGFVAEFEVQGGITRGTF